MDSWNYDTLGMSIFLLIKAKNMLLKREDIEEREKQLLVSYAVKCSESRGRKASESEDPFRTCFQRDRDRVIHSKAFRRLKGKTQVFVAHYGDHYRSRLAHSMEVAQLSRDIARMLNLNEDLAETIGLAHDLGHTPFGHAGQDAMNEMMQEYGKGFEHNEQSRRVVEFLEVKKPTYRGLNLSFEVTDGLIKHRTTYDRPTSEDTLMPSLEAQIVNRADEIAYMNHDIDDVLRSGILKFEDFEGLSIWKRAKQSVDLSLDQPFLSSAMISALIRTMVEDLADHTLELVDKAGVKTVDDIYETADDLALFSYEIQAETDELKSFLHERFYTSPWVAEYNEKGKEVIRVLFKKMMEDSSLLPKKQQENPHNEEQYLLVKDYIAGMTDGFALSLYDKLS